MPPATPQLQLQTLFILDSAGRIVSTREPRPSPGPKFVLIRGMESTAWAIRADVPTPIAKDLAALAAQEPALTSWTQAPRHERRYLEMFGGKIWFGPAFTFPDPLNIPSGDPVTEIHDESLLQRHFTGWVPGEIAAGRSPVIAICEENNPVSICFCARRSNIAAEAGLETGAAFRGRGCGTRVTAAWALAIRNMGLISLYSTHWDNGPSRAVAGKLGLVPYATDWSIE